MTDDIASLPFHRKYRPNTLNGYIGNSKLKETAMSALRQPNKPQVILLYGDSGCGKAQPLDSLVLTTSGYKKMGDIKVGDEVFTHRGNRGRVSGIYPQGIRPIYQIQLDDGTCIKVSDEHLNLVWNSHEEFSWDDLEPWETDDFGVSEVDVIDDEYKVLTTLELIEALKSETLYLVRDDAIIDNLIEEFDIYDEDLELEREAEIISVDYIGDMECQCIMIDHEDHTYISDFFIPTHNTTMARLLAKEYSCEDRDEETGACNECMNCELINEYIATGNTDNISNIKEIDITEQSGKNDLTAVLEDMSIPSFGDEWKIYIFDETHQASQALQNRLLKITEEPPEHVLIIFCTTNPEKLIPTLKNRCQLQLHVTKPKVKELAGLLKYVCMREDVDYDMQGLEFIANRGELTIRTALQNLQQVITEQQDAYYSSAIKVFETISNELISNYFRALKSNDVHRYITLLYEIKSKMELSVFLTELHGFITRGIYTINGISQDGVAETELKVYMDLFGDIGIAEITYLLNRVLSIDRNHIEIELMMLGYQGLDLPKQENKSDPLGLASILQIPNEVTNENKTAMQNIKKKDEVTQEQGIKNATNLTEDASIEMILAMGGTVVDNY